jgi:methylated-DNA-[protein]-cysteine S-methyltransferase
MQAWGRVEGGEGRAMAELRWWSQETPIGTIRVVVSDAGIRHIDLPGTSSHTDDALEERDDEVALELDEYFANRRRRFTMPLDFAEASAPFRRRVLETLQDDVGFGETVTYGELAARAGRPGAARAVGSAMANNPLPVVVPCHRVVGAGGSLGGYGGGLDLKRALLALEGLDV